MGSIESLASALMKAVGENDKEQEVKHWLDTGYDPLNFIVSGRYDGGFPHGRIMEVYGPSSSGKTALATRVMIAAQQAGGVAIFMDHEQSFDVGMAKRMGLSDEFPYWIYKLPETWEQSNMLVMKACQAIRASKAIPEEAPIVAVTDSVAACVPKSTQAKELDELSMNDTTALARVLSTTLKSIKPKVREFGVTKIFLNQIRTKPGVVYGDPTTTPGGQSMEFYADARLAISRQIVRQEKDGEKVMVGQNITMKAQKSKFTQPFKECVWRLSFKADGTPYFDVTGSLIDFLVEKGKLTSAGARISWTDGKSYFRAQLVEKIEREGLQDQLKKLVRGE